MNELPRAWASAKLADLTTKIGSGATPRGGEQAYKASGIPLIRSMNVHFDGFRRAGLAYLDQEQAAALDGVTVQSQDVLLNITGASIGRVSLAPDEMHGARVNQHVCIVRMKDGIEPRFVSSYLASPQMQRLITDENYGVTRQALTKGMIEEFDVPLPPGPEQHRIVAKLDTLSAHSTRARQELDRIPILIARYKQAILAKAFSGELTADWRKKQKLAKNWGGDNVGSLALDIRYGTAAKCGYEKTSTPVLRIPNIGKNSILLDDLKYADFTAAEIAKLSLREGDLLFIRSNGSLGLVGRAAIVTSSEVGLLYAGYLIRVRLDQKRVLPRFVLHLFSEPATRAHIESLAKSTSGVNNINSEQLAAVGVPLPSLPEQFEIVHRIDAAYEWLERLVTEYARAVHLLPKLDQAILAKAFRGELVPQDPNDEPADELLRRVQLKSPTKKKNG